MGAVWLGVVLGLYKLQPYSKGTVEARKLEDDPPPTPKPREEGRPAHIVPDPYSNFLESTVPKYEVYTPNHGVIPITAITDTFLRSQCTPDSCNMELR